MATARTIDLTQENRRLDDVAPPRAFLIAGLIGLGASAALAPTLGGWKSFLLSYLHNYCFFLSIALGGLFFVMVQHLTKAGWSVVVRRPAEVIASALPPMFLLVIPILFFMKQIYPWVDLVHAPAAEQHLLAKKQPFLTPVFFVVRMFIYFGLWAYLSYFFLKRSVEQDASGDPQLTRRMERLAAPGMLLFALTATFCAIDLIKTLNPAWFSTIFGVYFFAGCVVSIMSTLALLLMWLQARGRLTRVVTTEHYHDIGKLMFAFTVFWAYIAFSQYMLYWYANIPEETRFYLVRQTGGWTNVTLLLLFGHFIVPFLFLLSRFTKRHKSLLILGAVWLLAMHWIDYHWLIKPPENPDAAASALPTWLDLGCFVGVGGLFLWWVIGGLRRYSLLPERDPRLAESVAFENY